MYIWEKALVQLLNQNTEFQFIHITQLVIGIEKYFDLFIKIRQGHVRSRSTRRVTSENTFCNFRSILHHALHALRLMLININGQIISN